VRFIYCVSLLVSCAYAQPADSSLKFEVASVREGPPRIPVQKLDGCEGGAGTPDPVRLTCRITLYSSIIQAYDLKTHQFLPPDWTGITWFGIDAVVPPDTTKEQLHVMERNPLDERFHLAAHFEKKERQIYEMTIGTGGPEFQEWTDEPLLPCLRLSGLSSG